MAISGQEQVTFNGMMISTLC